MPRCALARALTASLAAHVARRTGLNERAFQVIETDGPDRQAAFASFLPLLAFSRISKHLLEHLRLRPSIIKRVVRLRRRTFEPVRNPT